MWPFPLWASATFSIRGNSGRMLLNLCACWAQAGFGNLGIEKHLLRVFCSHISAYQPQISVVKTRVMIIKIIIIQFDAMVKSSSFELDSPGNQS